MKNILYILIAVVILACGSPTPNKAPNYMFQLGDVVKLKIDSTKCMVVKQYNYNDGSGNRYEVKYKTKGGNKFKYRTTYIHEFELITKW